MGKFNYKYEMIKNVKKILEKQAQKNLAEIDLKIKSAMDKLAGLRIERADFIEAKDQPGRTKIFEVQMREDFLIQLDEKIAAVENEIIELQEKRKEMFRELEEKTKEKKVFETLEEKHLNEFIKDENKLEQLEIDDIATKRFIRESDS
jgi:flagellar FliJ protein